MFKIYKRNNSITNTKHSRYKQHIFDANILFIKNPHNFSITSSTPIYTQQLKKPRGVKLPKSNPDNIYLVKNISASTPCRRYNIKSETISKYCSTPLKIPVINPEKGPKNTCRNSPAKVVGTVIAPKPTAANKATVIAPCAPILNITRRRRGKNNKTAAKQINAKVTAAMPMLCFVLFLPEAPVFSADRYLQQ